MVVTKLHLETGESGALVANFDIGSAVVKSSLASTAYWQNFVNAIPKEKSHWDIVGFSDCSGPEAKNTSIRTARASAILGILPANVRPLIDSVEGAPLTECITENDNAGDRTLNRGVAFLNTVETVDEEGEVITSTLEHQAPDSEDCSPDQKKHMEVAFPLARKLGENAVSIVSSMQKGSPQEQLLVKFFGPDAYRERYHIKQNYLDGLRAWKGSPSYKCMADGDGPCSSGTDAETGFPAVLTGHGIVLCARAFGDDLDLADTILHEEMHALAWMAGDPEECGTSGCTLPTTKERFPGITMSDSGALGNASSYARFASEAHKAGF
jgi:hypothetical protein